MSFPTLVGVYRPQADDQDRDIRAVQAVVAELLSGRQGGITFKLLEKNMWGDVVHDRLPALSSVWVVGVSYADVVLLPCFAHLDAVGLRNTVAALALHSNYLGNDEIGEEMRMEPGLRQPNRSGSYTLTITHLIATIERSSVSAELLSPGATRAQASSSTSRSPGPPTPRRTSGTSLAGTPSRAAQSVARGTEVPLPQQAFVAKKRVLVGFHREDRSKERIQCQAIVAWIDSGVLLVIRPARHNIWGVVLDSRHRTLDENRDVQTDEIIFLPKYLGFESLTAAEKRTALKIIVAKFSLIGISAPQFSHWDDRRLDSGIPWHLAN